MERLPYAAFRSAQSREQFLYWKFVAGVAAPPLAYAAYRAGLSANAVTLASCLLALPMAWCNAAGHPAWAVALLHLFFMLDGADGTLARATKTCSARGVFLDWAGHHIVYTAYFLSLGVYLWMQGWWSSGVAAVALVCAENFQTGIPDTLFAIRVRSGATPEEALRADGQQLRRSLLHRAAARVVFTGTFPYLVLLLTASVWWLPALGWLMLYAGAIAVAYRLYMVRVFFVRLRSVPHAPA